MSAGRGGAGEAAVVAGRGGGVGLHLQGALQGAKTLTEESQVQTHTGLLSAAVLLP